MEQIIKPKLKSFNYNVQLNFPKNTRSNFNKLYELDKKLIGTKEYMGFAWFWDHGIKFYMRDSTAKQKKYIHDSFILNKIPFIKYKNGGYFKTNKIAEKIVEDYFNKT